MITRDSIREESVKANVDAGNLLTDVIHAYLNGGDVVSSIEKAITEIGGIREKAPFEFELEGVTYLATLVPDFDFGQIWNPEEYDLIEMRDELDGTGAWFMDPEMFVDLEHPLLFVYRKGKIPMDKKHKNSLADEAYNPTNYAVYRLEVK